MQKLSQTEELARTLAAHARRKTLTPDQISRAMEEADYDVARLDELYEALEARGVHIAEDEEAELPPLDETQLGQLEHELSAEGVALDDPVHTYLKEIGAAYGTAGSRPCPRRTGRGRRRSPCSERSQPAAGGVGGQALCRAGAAVSGPDSGRKPRPDEGGRKV